MNLSSLQLCVLLQALIEPSFSFSSSSLNTNTITTTVINNNRSITAITSIDTNYGSEGGLKSFYFHGTTNRNHKSISLATKKILSTRGGGTVPFYIRLTGGSAMTSDGSNENKEGDDDDDDEPVEVDIITDSKGSYIADSAKQMPNIASSMDEYDKDHMDQETRDQQSQSYFLSSVLWMSLAFDTVLNKKKRLLLFPAASAAASVVTEGVAAATGAVIEGVTAVAVGSATSTALPALAFNNIIATTHLASGYVLSSVIGWIVSISLKKKNSRSIRKRFHVLLASFGIINLGAHINPYSTAPFLGYGSIIISIHNALIAINGWLKELQVAEGKEKIGLMKELKDGIQSSFKSLIGRTTPTQFVSMMEQGNIFGYYIYILIAQISFIKALVLCGGTLIPHYTNCCIQGTLASASVEQLKMIGLKWASLGRLITTCGIALTLKEETEKNRLGSMVARSLNGTIALCALTSSIVPMVFSSEKVIPRRLVFIAIFTGMNAIKKRYPLSSTP